MAAIHKDKNKRHVTMAQHASENFRDPSRPKLFGLNGELQEPTLDNSNIPHSQAEMEELQKVYEKADAEINLYNSKVLDLDPDYTAFQPLTNIVVRCFHRKMELTSGGIFINPKIQATVQTQNGIGVVETQNAPWQFSTKAVVVSVPPGFKALKPGDVVQLHPGVIRPATKNVMEPEWNLPNGFTLHSYVHFEPPTYIMDKHFGYFIIEPYRGVLGILESKENTDGAVQE